MNRPTQQSSKQNICTCLIFSVLLQSAAGLCAVVRANRQTAKHSKGENFHDDEKLKVAMPVAAMRRADTKPWHRTGEDEKRPPD